LAVQLKRKRPISYINGKNVGGAVVKFGEMLNQPCADRPVAADDCHTAGLKGGQP
jgi:hypothetical protein